MGEDTIVVMNSFIYSNGGSVLNADGSCALGEPEAIEALEYLVDIQQYAPEGILNASSGDMRELFLNGALATEWWPALEQPTLQDSDLDWGFVNGTAPEGKTPVGTYGGWNLVMYKDSPHKEAVWKFIEFMTDPAVNGRVVDLIPANMEAADAFLKENREGPDEIFEHLNNARPRPLSPNYLQVSTIEQEMLQAIFSGTPVQDAVAAACSEIDGLELTTPRYHKTLCRRACSLPAEHPNTLWMLETKMTEMTPKERLLTALNRGVPDRLPVTTHHLMPYFLDKYMGGISKQEFFEHFGIDAIHWTVPHRSDPGQGEYDDPLQGEIGFLESRRVSTDNWRIEPEDIPGQKYKTTRYTFVTPKGSLTTVLQSNEHTSWVSEHLIKEKKDIDLIGEFATAPKCDVDAVNREVEEFGERGLVRGHICCFDVFGQPGTWQDAACLVGIEKLIFATFDDPTLGTRIAANSQPAQTGVCKIPERGQIRSAGTGRRRCLDDGHFARHLPQLCCALRFQIDCAGPRGRTTNCLPHLWAG